MLTRCRLRALIVLEVCVGHSGTFASLPYVVWLALPELALPELAHPELALPKLTNPELAQEALLELAHAELEASFLTLVSALCCRPYCTRRICIALFIAYGVT